MKVSARQSVEPIQYGWGVDTGDGMQTRATVAVAGLYWCLLVLYLVAWGDISTRHAAFFDDGAFYSMAYGLDAGLDFFEGLVDTKPPLLIYLIAIGFRISLSIAVIKWCRC
jgi:hypothetical protein